MVRRFDIDADLSFSIELPGEGQGGEVVSGTVTGSGRHGRCHYQRKNRQREYEVLS